MEISIALAFTTGLISFLAPCVLPLLPGYISIVTGLSFKELTEESSPKKYSVAIIMNSLIYTLGFTSVFVLLGLTASTIGSGLVQNRVVLSQIGGAVITLFGLSSLGFFNLPTLNKHLQHDFSEDLMQTKLLGPFLVGITFALAWTPCVGAILGGILTLAATTGSAAQAALLLFVYALGITTPFLILSFTLSSTYPYVQKLGPHLQTISKIGGFLLVLTGLLLLTNQFDLLGRELLQVVDDHEWYQSLLDRL